MPYGLTVSHIGRDKALELALEQQLEPPANPEATATEAPVLAEAPADLGVAPPPSLPGAQAPAPPAAVPPNALPTAPAAAPSPGAATPVKSLAGIWEGTFSFRGNVSGSYVGEVAVAVEGDSAEVSDFCPERGGTLTATGTGDAAAWQGHLVCPPIPLKGCAAAALELRLRDGDSGGRHAAGGGDRYRRHPGGLWRDSGPISVTFIAQKADYAHIAVTQNQGTDDVRLAERLGGPRPPSARCPCLKCLPEASAYLGIIRVKGSRLADIQRLLRHCHHLVLLHGEPVSMQLAVTHSPLTHGGEAPFGEPRRVERAQAALSPRFSGDARVPSVAACPQWEGRKPGRRASRAPGRPRPTGAASAVRPPAPPTSGPPAPPATREASRRCCGAAFP